MILVTKSKIEESFKKWQTSAKYDADLIKELKEIENDRAEIEDRFYKDLDFGTAGIRGIIGAGTNRMNVYVVGRITQAFSIYLNKLKPNNLVAISFDSRIKSEFFAKTAAQVFAANGIKVKIFKELKPVPILSYAVRHLNCDGGVMITASHNPSEYNGYKIYGNDGCQVLDDVALKISDFIKNIDIFGFSFGNFEESKQNGLISFCDDEIERSFLNCVKKSLIQPEILNYSAINAAYTPLHGSGMEPVQRMLKKLHVGSVHIVECQRYPNGNFPTCKSPNPEQFEVFNLAIEYCNKHNLDVAIASDPDCDRVGVVVRQGVDDGYKILNGNQIGVLMLNYICQQRLEMGTMPKKPVAITTIVSTPMAEKIAAHYGIELQKVLTGFKYIGEKIGEFEKKGEQSRFIFGFEESQGYLAGSYVRDKDGVFAAMLICEMVAFYKNKFKKNLLDVLNELHNHFGHYKSVTQSIVLKGKHGLEQMMKIMDWFRTNRIDHIGGFKIYAKLDYFLSKAQCLSKNRSEIYSIKLPKSNVIEFRLKNKSKIIIRVSGTEPKIKIYYHVVGCNEKEATELANKLQESFTCFCNHINQ